MDLNVGFSLGELTRVGICVDVLAIAGEMRLARRMPAGLAGKKKKKESKQPFHFLFLVLIKVVKKSKLHPHMEANMFAVARWWSGNHSAASLAGAKMTSG